MVVLLHAVEQPFQPAALALVFPMSGVLPVGETVGELLRLLAPAALVHGPAGPRGSAEVQAAPRGQPEEVIHVDHPTGGEVGEQLTHVLHREALVVLMNTYVKGYPT